MQSASEPPQGLPVAIPAGSVVLEGALEVSDGRRGVVLFAHGSGSSRHSPRNQFVARSLRDAGLATLLIDLLTVEEERSDAATGRLRFDIRLLAGRLVGITDWLGAHPETRGLPIGYFGASTGAAAALVAAAQRPAMIAAIVSRGGRPDLGRPHLSAVRAPALEGLYGKSVPLGDGTMAVADERYLGDSIIRPRTQVAAGYQPVMPSYEGKISEDELIAIVAYIKSLADAGSP